MTNAEIILTEQITRGITEELHTFSKWKSLGFKVKAGEHGIETRLWKYNKKHKEEVPDDADEETKKKYRSGFYLAKSYLFKRSQVEEIKEEEK